MKKTHALAMAISALSAGLLVSCVKPNDNQAANDKPQEVSKDNSAAAKTDTEAVNITPVEISADTKTTYLNHVADDLIIPAYAKSSQKSLKLHDLAKSYCGSAPITGEKLDELRAAWLELAQAWSAAEMVNFGPATDSMSNLYINYYPDERGLVHQGVADLIRANPNLTPDQLADESAVVQGVPGLEEALFANDTLDAGECAYVISASAALHQRLTAIEKNWQDNKTTLLAIDNVDNNQGLNKWFNSLLSMVETMKSNAIDQPLGLSSKAKGHLPAATAKQSREIISAKLAALNQAFSDPVFTAMLGANGESEVDNKLSTALADTTTLLAQLPEDIGAADKANQQQLLEDLTTITRVIKRELMPTLGVRVGFNSTDGD